MSAALARRPIPFLLTLEARQARDLAAALRQYEAGLADARPATCLGIPGHVAPHTIRNADFCCGDYDADGWCRDCCEDPRQASAR